MARGLPFPEQPWKGCRAQKHGLNVTCIATPDPTPWRAGLCLEEPLAGKFSATWTTFPKLKPLSSSSTVSSLSFFSPKDDCLQMLQDRVETQLPFPPPAGASSFLVLVRGSGCKVPEAESACSVVLLSLPLYQPQATLSPILHCYLPQPFCILQSHLSRG